MKDVTAALEERKGNGAMRGAWEGGTVKSVLDLTGLDSGRQTGRRDDEEEVCEGRRGEAVRRSREGENDSLAEEWEGGGGRG